MGYRSIGFVVIGYVALGLSGPGCKGKGKGDKGPPPAKLDAGAPVVREIPRPTGVTLDPAVLDKLRVTHLTALPFDLQTQRLKLCFKPPEVDPATVDVDRSLFVHDRATLDAIPGAFALQRTLDKIAADAVAAGATGTTGATVFRDLWDTQNPVDKQVTPEGAKCEDPINGFTNVCRPIDGAQAHAADLASEIATYQPIAVVNRLDLAADGWKNCGEHRIVYGRQGAGVARSFIIFEAVLPNPRPGCQSGCRAVANLWYGLSSIDDPVTRADQLQKLFYTGLPGFRPVVHVDHYAARGGGGYSGGSGQIRTNQFLEQPWLLKEFKLALDCSTTPCVLDAVPIPVKGNPEGNLWTENTAGLADSFQQTVVLPQVASLADPDINTFSYQVPVVYDGARSVSQSSGGDPVDNYRVAYTAVPGVAGGFRADLSSAATTAGLTDVQLVNRATALSCAGCHEPRTFGLDAPDALGPGMSWPASAGFVHVRAEASGGIHALSPALVDQFLPARKANLVSFLNDPVCLCRFRKPPIDLTPFEDRLLPRPPRSLDDLRRAEIKLAEAINAELRRRGQPPLPDLAVDPRAQPLTFDTVKAAADPVARGLARRAAVEALVRDEPPRKTVTGHFRVE